MNEPLDPKEIARIKKLARSGRIRRIRRRAAVVAATLAAVFSGAILVRTQFEQSPAAAGTQTAVVSNTGTGSVREPGDDGGYGSGDDHGESYDDEDRDEHEYEDEGEHEGDEHAGSGVLNTIVDVATGVVNGGNSQTRADSAPQTAAPLTTSQS